jgi:hypothetical protein
MGGLVTDLRTYAQLRFAIANKRLVQLSYQNARRVVEPHDYGVQGGVERLFVHQLRTSPARPGKQTVGWRLLDVVKIDDLVVLEQTFPGSRAEARQKHMVWDVVYARVAAG